MNLKVGYIPFAGDDALEKMACTVMIGHNSVHKLDRFSPNYYTKGDSLKHLYTFQQLYIFAHGAEGSPSMSSCTHETLFVNDLATQLKDAKLTLAIAKVKLWICSGGAGGALSTAKQLKDAMLAAGFNKVKVYGYTKTLDSGIVDGHKWGSDYDFDTGVDSNIQYAKNIRVSF